MYIVNLYLKAIKYIILNIYRNLNRVPKTQESTTEMATEILISVSSHLINNLFAAISGTNSMIHYKGLINVWADDNPNKD